MGIYSPGAIFFLGEGKGLRLKFWGLGEFLQSAKYAL